MWINNVPAILYAWYPSEQDGSAIADLLLGYREPFRVLAGDYAGTLGSRNPVSMSGSR